MKFIVALFLGLLFIVPDARAQDKNTAPKLFVGSGVSSGAYYNKSTTSGSQPISLKRIVKGRKIEGNKSYGDAGIVHQAYIPSLSAEESIRSRARRDAQAQYQEQSMTEDLFSANLDSLYQQELQQFRTQLEQVSTIPSKTTTTKTRLKYSNQREKFDKPARVFTSF